MSGAATLVRPPAAGPLVGQWLPWRGCDLCQHGRGPEGLHRRCGHPHAPDAPVDQVRRPGGACGPEAELLHLRGM